MERRYALLFAGLGLAIGAQAATFELRTSGFTFDPPVITMHPGD